MHQKCGVECMEVHESDDIKYRSVCYLCYYNDTTVDETQYYLPPVKKSTSSAKKKPPTQKRKKSKNPVDPNSKKIKFATQKDAPPEYAQNTPVAFALEGEKVPQWIKDTKGSIKEYGTRIGGKLYLLGTIIKCMEKKTKYKVQFKHTMLSNQTLQAYSIPDAITLLKQLRSNSDRVLNEVHPLTPEIEATLADVSANPYAYGESIVNTRFIATLRGSCQV